MLIIVGRGIRLANAIEELILLAKQNYYPILTTILGKDLLDDKLSWGTVGIRGNSDKILYEFIETYFVGCSMPIAQLGYDLSKWKGKKVYSVNIEQPNGLIKCEWIKKDAKVWLREQLGYKS